MSAVVTATRWKTDVRIIRTHFFGSFVPSSIVQWQIVFPDHPDWKESITEIDGIAAAYYKDLARGEISNRDYFLGGRRAIVNAARQRMRQRGKDLPEGVELVTSGPALERR